MARTKGRQHIIHTLSHNNQSGTRGQKSLGLSYGNCPPAYDNRTATCQFQKYGIFCHDNVILSVDLLDSNIQIEKKLAV
jgi:hypothetical protein